MKKEYKVPFIRMVEADSENLMENLSLVQEGGVKADPNGPVLSRQDNGWTTGKNIWDEEDE